MGGSNVVGCIIYFELTIKHKQIVIKLIYSIPKSISNFYVNPSKYVKWNWPIGKISTRFKPSLQNFKSIVRSWQVSSVLSSCSRFDSGSDPRPDADRPRVSESVPSSPLLLRTQRVRHILAKRAQRERGHWKRDQSKGSNFLLFELKTIKANWNWIYLFEQPLVGKWFN